MGQKYPLSKNPGWRFVQFSVGLRAPIQTVPTEGKSKGSKVYINASSTCREGVVGNVRNRLSSALGRNAGGSWGQTQYTQHWQADLNLDSLKAPGESYLQVGRGHITQYHQLPNPKAGQVRPRARYWAARYDRGRKWGDRATHLQPEFILGHLRLTKSRVQDFIHFCDAIIGPITVLLNPDRFQGNWWETSVEEALRRNQDSCLRWYGVDNTVIAHPALVSLYTGLARQCALLARCNIRDEVLRSIDRKELRACLTQSDPEAALRIAKTMRRWIEVPVPKYGDASNIPVPIGGFKKIPALHKAIYKHGFDKTFGRQFHEGWALGQSIYGPASYAGIHAFMGRKGDNRNGKRIQKLAA